jgi:hypothetical protein
MKISFIFFETRRRFYTAMQHCLCFDILGPVAFYCNAIYALQSVGGAPLAGQTRASAEKTEMMEMKAASR